MATGTLVVRPVKFSPNWNLKERTCVCVFKKPWALQNPSQWAICARLTILSGNSQDMNLRNVNANADITERQRIK